MCKKVLSFYDEIRLILYLLRMQYNQLKIYENALKSLLR